MSSNAWVRLEGYRRGAGATILAIGYDLLAGLTEGEVEAVFAHEMGHAKFVRRGIKHWSDSGLRRIRKLTTELSGQVEIQRRAGNTFELASTFLRISIALTTTSARLLANPETAQLIVRLHLKRRQFEAAAEAAELLRRADSCTIWLVRLGEMFEAARRDTEGVQFFEESLRDGYYPEAHLGLARIALRRRDRETARLHLISALNVEHQVGERGQTPLELFEGMVQQLTMLEEPREKCIAWIVTFPKNATPAAFSQRSLMLFATDLAETEQYLARILSAMQPDTPITPVAALTWQRAPKNQQPVQPVRPGLQCVL